MKIGPSFQVPLSRCIYCGAKLDAAFGAGNDGSPAAGDVSLCIKCAGWMIYGPNLELRRPNREEMAEIGKDRDCQRAYQAAVVVSREHTEKN